MQHRSLNSTHISIIGFKFLPRTIRNGCNHSGHVKNITNALTFQKEVIFVIIRTSNWTLFFVFLKRMRLTAVLGTEAKVLYKSGACAHAGCNDTPSEGRSIYWNQGERAVYAFNCTHSSARRVSIMVRLGENLPPVGGELLCPFTPIV